MKKAFLLSLFLFVTPALPEAGCIEDCIDYCDHEAYEYAGGPGHLFWAYWFPCTDGCFFGCEWDESP